MKRQNTGNHPIISRGPEIIPRQGTRAWYEYVAGRRFYEPVLPGQRFPEGANQKQLDQLAVERRQELDREIASQATAAVAELHEVVEAPEPLAASA